MKLTPKQKAFADEYLIDLNATRSYKAVYKNIKNDDVASQAGSRLLRNVKVKSYLDERMKAREKRTEITQDKVLNELARIGFANATDYARVIQKEYIEKILDENGEEIGEETKTYTSVELELTENLSREQQSVIAGIKQGANGIEVKLNDKVKALELIGKHLGMFTDKVELSGSVNNEVVIEIGAVEDD